MNNNVQTCSGEDSTQTTPQDASASSYQQLEAIKAQVQADAMASPLMDLFNRFEITRLTDIKPTEYLAEVLGKPFLAVGEITLIYGKQKSGKTGYMRDLISCVLGGERSNIAKYIGTSYLNIGYFDMEQSKADTKEMFDYIPEQIPTGREFHAFNLRVCEEEDENGNIIVIDQIDMMVRIVEAMARHGEHPFNLIIIDTIGDAISDMNDQEKALQKVREFLAWISQMDIAVLAIAHTNKNDDNVQGHWGYQLQKKAHDGMLVKMHGDYEYQSITHKDCRGNNRHIMALGCEQVFDGKKLQRKYSSLVDCQSRHPTKSKGK